MHAHIMTNSSLPDNQKHSQVWKVEKLILTFPIPHLWPLLILSSIEYKLTKIWQHDNNQKILTKPKEIDAPFWSPHIHFSFLFFPHYAFLGSLVYIVFIEALVSRGIVKNIDITKDFRTQANTTS